MSEGKKRRFFWLEGVTRDEVEKSLRDTRPSRFRQQGARRALVFVMGAALGVLAMSILIPDRKVATYLEAALFIVTLLLYFKLRSSVRHVSDAPNEMLDERQIRVRDACYTVAYRLLAALSIPYLVIFVATSGDGVLAYLTSSKSSGLLYSYIMCVASLPVMVLGWTMPSELSDESA